MKTNENKLLYSQYDIAVSNKNEQAKVIFKKELVISWTQCFVAQFFLFVCVFSVKTPVQSYILHKI